MGCWRWQHSATIPTSSIRLHPVSTRQHTLLTILALQTHLLSSKVPSTHPIRHAAFTVQAHSQLHLAFPSTGYRTSPARVCTADLQIHSQASLIHSSLDLTQHPFTLSQARCHTCPAQRSGPINPHSHAVERCQIKRPTKSSNPSLK